MATPKGISVRNAFKKEGLLLNEAKLFEGARVSVSESGERVFLVGGTSPMTGGDNRFFWLVRQSGAEAEVLLHDGTNCFYIESQTTRGYKNIETIWSSASSKIIRRYQYDGNSYKLINEKSGRITDGKSGYHFLSMMKASWQ